MLCAWCCNNFRCVRHGRATTAWRQPHSQHAQYHESSAQPSVKAHMCLLPLLNSMNTNDCVFLRMPSCQPSSKCHGARQVVYHLAPARPPARLLRLLRDHHLKTVHCLYHSRSDEINRKLSPVPSNTQVGSPSSQVPHALYRTDDHAQLFTHRSRATQGQRALCIPLSTFKSFLAQKRPHAFILIADRCPNG